MRLMSIVPTEQGFNWKAIITAADVAGIGASASGLLQIFPRSGSVPAGTRVMDCFIRLVTAFDFSDAGITSLLAEVGDDGDPNRFAGQVQVAVDGTEVFNTARALTTSPYVYEAANGIDITFTAANGGSPLLSECNAGELEVYLRLDYPPSNVNTLR
jgi:hypothetical protein